MEWLEGLYGSSSNYLQQVYFVFIILLEDIAILVVLWYNINIKGIFNEVVVVNKEGYWGFCIACAEICAEVWNILADDVIQMFYEYNVPSHLAGGDLYYLMDHWDAKSIAREVQSYISSKGGVVHA